jgi:Rps23 Pro-64 3,4-dihydroxylase Tpa1-like proline 4-hydroxylase
MTTARTISVIMPPYVVVRDFLDQADVIELLDYAVAHEANFIPTGVGKATINRSVRFSAVLRDLGRFKSLLTDKLVPMLPQFIDRLRVSQFDFSGLETELVAHGDGAFYKQHIDTQTARYDEVKSIRVLSGVYYFNADPKAFTGGSLRLFAIGAKDQFADIEPVCNSLLVFPSWAPHEVLPVSCPSKRFIDSRFAINCWFHRDRAAAASA